MSDLQIPFDNRYVQLPARFYARVQPTPVSAPRLIRFNPALADALGIVHQGVDDARLAQLLSGNALPAGAEPLAQAYCGHQFGQLNPRLGDGRAILLGEVVDAAGQRRDIQLKGAGRTPYSRGGDGRAPLGPVLREYIVSEAMHALGVPTTRALAAVATGDAVIRNDREPGAVLTRVAASHIRVGTFQYFALDDDREALALLADHVLQRHYLHIDAADPSRYIMLLEAICRRQASLVSQWMLLGFVHGVMNTDNMTISGETIDYGPCAFMDAYDPNTVFSYIDKNGRYAWRNQPGIAQWNLARLAEALLVLIDTDETRAIDKATAVLQQFRGWHNDAWLAGMRRKLGLFTAHDNDTALADELLDMMASGQADYTLFFRRLSDAVDPSEAPASLHDLLLPELRQRLSHWHERWQARCALEATTPDQRRDAMRQANPAVIPRNHRVAEAIAAAMDGDYAPFEKLNAALANPWSDTEDNADYQRPPEPAQRVCTTFCGT